MLFTKHNKPGKTPTKMAYVKIVKSIKNEYRVAPQEPFTFTIESGLKDEVLEKVHVSSSLLFKADRSSDKLDNCYEFIAFR